jgi:UDP-N-acetylglucosamine 2-epimerase (non-hydrolysing)
MKKILLVFGTRPEAIKMMPLVKEFQKYPDKFKTIVCVTAQHREMLDQVLHLFQIMPDYDLNIMEAGQDLYDVTSRVLLGMRSVIKEIQPHIVFVHGDTTTSTAAALASFYQKIPVGHIEAGLRTHDIYSPWPEEMNRQITSKIASYHFAPTVLSKQNLLLEGIKNENIFITGNTVIDSLYWVIDKMKNDKTLKKTITQTLVSFGLPIKKIQEWENHSNPLLTLKSLSQRKLILITGHRRENFGQGFINICKAIKELSESYPDIDFVYPMHLNPNVRNTIKQIFRLAKNQKPKVDNLYFIEPLDYLPFVYLMNQSYLVLTDSGGIQEEAPGLGKPVLVMRDTTERPEALKAGTVKLVGTDKKLIIEQVSKLIKNKSYYLKMSKANNPYGDGKACSRILNTQ